MRKNVNVLSAISQVNMLATFAELLKKKLNTMQEERKIKYCYIREMVFIRNKK